MKTYLLSLLALLALLGAGGSLNADLVMGISHIAQANIAHPYKVAAMEGDSLALYNYGVSGNTITITRFTVSPAGVVSTPQTIWSYDCDPSWGAVSEWYLDTIFTHKNGLLLAAFSTPAKLVVAISGADGTQLHLFDNPGAPNTEYQFYLVNENLGFLMDFYQSQARIFRMDLSDGSLVLLHSNPTTFDIYFLMSFADDYLLFATTSWSSLPEYLYQGPNLLHTYVEHWYPYFFFFGNYESPRVCGQHYFVRLDDGLDKDRGTALTAVAYVANNLLQLIPLYSAGHVYGYIGSSVAHSDSTFSCIHYIMGDMRYILEWDFRNYTITNGELVLDTGFPQIDIEDHPPFGMCKMNADYMVLANNPRFTLVDFSEQSIRHFNFPLEPYQGWAWKLHLSDPYFYVLRPDKVHVFILEEYLPVDDEVLPPAEPSISIYPNPFAADCQIRIEGSAPQNVGIYNLKGQRVRDLADTGENSFVWDGRDERGDPVAGGMYLVRVVDRGRTYSRKLMLCK
ncbi:MAG: T9SS type A sorting domain-containing protein [Candidatus Syntrophosphaera sp.]|nr:T9SS type A sorting domain-containing protein [Candidatus Syntrophosphaera sp.]